MNAEPTSESAKMPSKTSNKATREVFGQNLRRLMARHKSVSKVSRDLGINRAQFNRYLTGESHPRPDALKSICEFFGTDARILVTPLDQLTPESNALNRHAELSHYALAGRRAVSEADFPSGFYRVSRNSFLYPDKYFVNLLYVYRKDDWTFVKGYEARQSIRDQGLPMDARTRQFRGFALKTDKGVSAIISRLGAITCTFNYFAPVVSLNQNFWQGYTARTETESLGNKRISRTALEYLGTNTHEILRTARSGGVCDESALLPFHLKLLQPGAAFS